MIAFPGMLVPAAQKAGMSVPPDAEEFESYKETHVHFFIFCMLQLGRPTVYHGEHWNNAKLIADIPEDEVKTLTLQDFLARGLSFAS